MYWLQNLISSQRNIPCEFIKTPQIWPWSPWCPRRWSSRGRGTWPRPVWCCWLLGAVITESHQNHIAKMVEALSFINLIHSTAAKFWLGQFLYFTMVLLYLPDCIFMILNIWKFFEDRSIKFKTKLNIKSKYILHCMLPFSIIRCNSLNCYSFFQKKRMKHAHFKAIHQS